MDIKDNCKHRWHYKKRDWELIYCLENLVLIPQESRIRGNG